MSWEKGFVIERDDTLRKRVNCKDCIYYDSSDRSCNKRPVYPPEYSYKLWENCKEFIIATDDANKLYRVYKRKGGAGIYRNYINKEIYEKNEPFEGYKCVDINIRELFYKAGVEKDAYSLAQCLAFLPENLYYSFLMKENVNGGRDFLLKNIYVFFILIGKKPNRTDAVYLRKELNKMTKRYKTTYAGLAEPMSRDTFERLFVDAVSRHMLVTHALDIMCGA